MAVPQPHLHACPDCTKLVSVRAQTCPHCGAVYSSARPSPSWLAPLAILIGIVVLILVLRESGIFQ